MLTPTCAFVTTFELTSAIKHLLTLACGSVGFMISITLDPIRIAPQSMVGSSPLLLNGLRASIRVVMTPSVDLRSSWGRPINTDPMHLIFTYRIISAKFNRKPLDDVLYSRLECDLSTVLLDRSLENVHPVPFAAWQSGLPSFQFLS